MINARLPEGARGFTLLETLVAMSIFMIITLLAMNIFIHASKASSSIMLRQELLENARFAMDSIITNTQKAKAVDLVSGTGGTLIKLTLTEYQPYEGKDHKYVYAYFGGSVSKPHTLEFGGNEMARYIANLHISIDRDVMSIEMTTDGSVSGMRGETSPITLRGSVSVRHKDVRQ